MGSVNIIKPHLVTKHQSRYPVGAEMRGKKDLAVGKRVEREKYRTLQNIIKPLSTDL